MSTVIAGRSYTVEAQVTNRSTLEGVGVAVTLDVVPTGVVGATQLAFSPNRSSIYLGPYVGGALFFNFTVPTGTEGQVGRVDANVFSPTGQWLASDYEDLSVQAVAPTVVSFYFMLYFPPAGWDYWLAGWWDGTQWNWEPRGWISSTQMTWFQNVKPGPGCLGFYLWRSDTATTSPFYEQYPQFITVNNGEYWVYDFRTGTFTK